MVAVLRFVALVRLICVTDVLERLTTLQMVKVTTTSKYRPHFKPGKALRVRVDEGKMYPIKVKIKASDALEEEALMD